MLPLLTTTHKCLQDMFLSCKINFKPEISPKMNKGSCPNVIYKAWSFVPGTKPIEVKQNFPLALTGFWSILQWTSERMIGTKGGKSITPTHLIYFSLFWWVLIKEVSLEPWMSYFFLNDKAWFERAYSYLGDFSRMHAMVGLKKQTYETNIVRFLAWFALVRTA